VSFHTLAEVKNRALSEEETSEPLVRVAGERHAVRAADVVLVPTPVEATHLIELYGAAPEQLRIVPPGVDHEAFFPRDREEARARLGLHGNGAMVLFLGRMQPIKGPDVALRAFAAARRRSGDLRDATLVMVGGPSGSGGSGTVADLRRLAETEGIAGSVILQGPRPHHELPWVYSAADVLLMPSRSEAFGLTALEAQACGVPVLAADVGGLPEVVDGGGVVIAGHDPVPWGEALLDMLPKARAPWRPARASASRFDWDRTVDGTLEVYGELVGDLAPAAAS
jgi:D-inositol-3-phosphate glycosyltransferase